jgi:hypothetical protein
MLPQRGVQDVQRTAREKAREKKAQHILSRYNAVALVSLNKKMSLPQLPAFPHSRVSAPFTFCGLGDGFSWPGSGLELGWEQWQGSLIGETPFRCYARSKLKKVHKDTHTVLYRITLMSLSRTMESYCT